MKSKTLVLVTTTFMVVTMSSCVYDRVVMNQPLSKSESKSEASTEFNSPVKIEPLTEFTLPEISNLTETILPSGKTDAVNPSTKKNISFAAENNFTSVPATIYTHTLQNENIPVAEYLAYDRYVDTPVLFNNEKYADYIWLPWLGLAISSAAVALGIHFSKRMDRFQDEIEKEFT